IIEFGAIPRHRNFGVVSDERIWIREIKNGDFIPGLNHFQSPPLARNAHMLLETIEITESRRTQDGRKKFSRAKPSSSALLEDAPMFGPIVYFARKFGKPRQQNREK